MESKLIWLARQNLFLIYLNDDIQKIIIINRDTMKQKNLSEASQFFSAIIKVFVYKMKFKNFYSINFWAFLQNFWNDKGS